MHAALRTTVLLKRVIVLPPYSVRVCLRLIDWTISSSRYLIPGIWLGKPDQNLQILEADEAQGWAISTWSVPDLAQIHPGVLV